VIFSLTFGFKTVFCSRTKRRHQVIGQQGVIRTAAHKLSDIEHAIVVQARL
jgi:hypothetical protein